MPSFIILLVLLGLMYVVLIVPRQREMRRHNQLMSELAEGEEVMTGSGLYGTIGWIEGDFVGLEIADGVVAKVARRSIAARVVEPDAAATTDETDGSDLTDASAGERSDPGDIAAAPSGEESSGDRSSED